jgi:hypothetical protein
MSYENFIHHRDANAMTKAQAKHDAAMPLHDCAIDGHRWKRLPGEAKDGTKARRCRVCGEQELE